MRALSSNPSIPRLVAGVASSAMGGGGFLADARHILPFEVRIAAKRGQQLASFVSDRLERPPGQPSPARNKRRIETAQLFKAAPIVVVADHCAFAFEEVEDAQVEPSVSLERAGQNLFAVAHRLRPFVNPMQGRCDATAWQP